jgi:hypothetical protein
MDTVLRVNVLIGTLEPEEDLVKNSKHPGECPYDFTLHDFPKERN